MAQVFVNFSIYSINNENIESEVFMAISGRLIIVFVTTANNQKRILDKKNWYLDLSLIQHEYLLQWVTFVGPNVVSVLCRSFQEPE